MPTLTRSLFIMANIACMPLCGIPTSQPLASEKFIWQVAEALSPILCSSPTQVTPLRAPADACSPGISFGTRNMLMP